MLEAILLVAFCSLLYVFYRYIRLIQTIETRAKALHDRWRKETLDVEAGEIARQRIQEWTAREESRIRADAISRSQATINGKITEHLIPYFSNFPYNPKDARFLGTPVDFIIFDGLSEGAIKKVVFVEVKTGKSGRLSERENAVQDCVHSGCVSFRLIHHKSPLPRHVDPNAAIKEQTRP